MQPTHVEMFFDKEIELIQNVHMISSELQVGAQLGMFLGRLDGHNATAGMQSMIADVEEHNTAAERNVLVILGTALIGVSERLSPAQASRLVQIYLVSIAKRQREAIGSGCLVRRWPM